MMGWYDNGWGSGLGTLVMLLVMLLVWGSVVALGVWAVARLTRGESRPTTPESARHILDRRFASGELDAEKYAEARRILEGGSAVTPTPHS